MDYGLGLVLSFTDNATSGIQSAVSTLQQLTSVAENASNSLTNIASLSAFSSIANTVGNSMLSTGSAILSTFSQIIGKVNEVGATLGYAEISFDKLYEGTEKSGKDVLAEIQEYAQRSIFAFEDLIPVVRMLKANGIDAFQSIASSTGKSNQLLMDYASDLAAFNPQMRNAYGQGIQAAMGALNEYIAEGNKRLLKSGASLDITQLLGEGVGKTIEERSRQVADLLEQLNMVGMTAGMAGTPMQQLSNMGDVLFSTLGKIADLGVYDEFKKILSTFAEWVFAIPDDELEQIAKTVADALVMIMKPVEKLAGQIVKLADGFKKFLINNPGLAKFVTLAGAVSGALLILGGIAMKALASFGYMSLMITTLGKSFAVIKTAMITGIKSIMASLIPLTIAIGLMYLAWKNDFAGIRSNVTWFVDQVQMSFGTAKNAVSGDVNTLIEAMNKLNVSANFFDGLTLAIMRVMVLFTALKEGWDDYTLSEDTFLKAKELGILPLIEAIFDLKYRFENFMEGFIEGWGKISKAVEDAFKSIQKSASGTVFDKMLSGMTKFFELLSNNDAEAWKQFGETCAFVSSAIIGLGVAFKVFGAIATVVKIVGGAFETLAKAFGIIKGVIAPVVKGFSEIATLLKGGMIAPSTTLSRVFMQLGTTFSRVSMIVQGAVSAISNAFTALATAIGIPVSALVAIIIAAVGSIVVYAVTHWEEFKAKILTVWTTIKDQASKTWGVIKGVFLSVFDTIRSGVSKVVSAFSGFISRIQEIIGLITSSSAFHTLVDVLSMIGEVLVDILVPAINTVTTLFFSGFRAIFVFVTSTFKAIFSAVSSVMAGIMNVINGILDIIIGIFTGDLDRIFQGVSTIFNAIFDTIASIIMAVVEFLTGAFQAIVDIFVSVGGSLIGIVSGAFQAVLAVVQTILSGVFGVVQNVWNNIKTTVDTVVSGLSTNIQTKWSGIKNTITNAINGARDAVKSAIDKMKSFFNFTWKLPEIKLPHFTATGSFSLNPPSVPSFSVQWYKEGGVFNRPSVIGVGEQGTEAVMPLERNTGWITQLAGIISAEMREFVPVNTRPLTPEAVSNRNTYYNGDTSTSTSSSSTDNSVHFESGAIQIHVANATREEAEKMAEYIMGFIERKKQINAMLSYNT